MNSRLFKRHLVLVFLPLLSMMVSGCVSTKGQGQGLESVKFASYDLPQSLPPNSVIGALEQAFREALGVPVRVLEGSVPPKLPDAPAGFRVEPGELLLELLGPVSIPHVVCQENMATLHAYAEQVPAHSGLHGLTGCIELYAKGYRVHIVESVLATRTLGEIGSGSSATLVPRVARAFLERVPDARPVDRFAASASPTNPAPSFGSSTLHSALPSEHGGVSISPLVCLAPRHKAATVRSEPGGRVVRTLQSGSVLAVAEPVDAAYFRVEAEDGSAGWVNRSDVKRLPCPVG